MVMVVAVLATGILDSCVPGPAILRELLPLCAYVVVLPRCLAALNNQPRS